jgi:hypothetical protein
MNLGFILKLKIRLTEKSVLREFCLSFPCYYLLYVEFMEIYELPLAV